MIRPYKNGKYLVQNVTAAEFNKEYSKYYDTGIMSEGLGEMLLKMIYNYIYTGKTLSSANESVKTEALDFCIINTMNNFHKTKNAKYPYSFVSNMIRNRIVSYVREHSENSKHDMYGQLAAYPRKRTVGVPKWKRIKMYTIDDITRLENRDFYDD